MTIPVQSNDIDYTKHINVSSPSTVIISEDTVTLLKTILTEIQKLNNISPTNYHSIYSVDTSVTTKQKIDIISDTGSYSIEMVIISKGGGFNININDESQSIPVSDGTRVINEKIEKVYWTGSGASGIGKIRFGMIK